MIEFLQGKKTYVVMIAGILVNGAYAMGYLNEETLAAIDGLLMFLGMGTIRAGITKAGR